jgi:hypothetical protein
MIKAKTESRRHCSDEQLVGHMDGELSPFAAWSVRAHLSVCYLCRQRRKELEEQALRVAVLLETNDYPGAKRVSDAFDSFLTRQAAVEGPAVPSQGTRSGSRGPFWKLAAAACLLLVVAGVYWKGETTSAEPGPEKLIAEAQAAEAELVFAGAHQVLQIIAKGPGAQAEADRAEARIEIWSDRQGRRYSSELSDLNGRLRHAVWLPKPDGEFIYTAGSEQLRASAPLRTGETNLFMDLVSLPAPSTEFDQFLVDWLRTRTRTPVLLARDFERFSRGVGAVVEVTPCAEAETSICLAARRTLDGKSIRLVLEVDRLTYRTRRSVILLDAPEGVTEVQLVVERSESLPQVQLIPAVFEPRPSLLRPRRPQAPVRAARRRTPVAPSVEPALSADEAEARLRHALHTVNACRGEAIEILRADDSGLRVQGVAASEAQLERWQLAIGSVELPLNWKVDLRMASFETSSGPLAEIQAEPVASRNPPIERRLVEFFESAGSGNRGVATRQAGDLINRMLAESQTALTEAGALRRLAERYPDLDGMTDGTSKVVAALLADHSAALGAATHSLRETVTAVWGPIDNPILVAGSGASWNEAVLGLFRDVEEMNSTIVRLCTGSPVVDDSEIVANLDQRMALLLGRLAETEARSASLRRSPLGETSLLTSE